MNEEMLPGVEVVPLRTPTLPPATHTNAVLVGRRRVWVVDPGTPHASEREALVARIEARRLAGHTLEGIVLSHHHVDHVGAAAWLREATGMPLLAHPRTAELLRSSIAIDGTLDEGAVLEGGERPEDRWHVLHTPGHARGHIVLWQPETHVLVVGDMVAATGTIVIDPPDGHMATYIAQLDRLAALGPRLLVPAHGPIIEDAVARLRFYVRHRLDRESRVARALAAGPSDLATLTARSYPDVPRALYPLAQRSCLAHLVKLVEEERAREVVDGPRRLWERATA